MIALSPSEAAFVEALVELGDPSAAAAASGVQPSLARDPRIQSALVDTIRDYGASDAARARKVLYDLSLSADNDGVRLRAAQTLWERGLGKVPDQVHITHEITSLPRDALYGEIRALIRELGLPTPETIEGAFEEVGEPALGSPECASVAQPVEHPEPPEGPPTVSRGGREVEGSSPSAGISKAKGGYVPTLPTKWR